MVNMDAKKRIGRLAASLVGDGETIILDSGSTTTEVAMNLLERQNLNVVTNALNIALAPGALAVVLGAHAGRPVQGADPVAERRALRRPSSRGSTPEKAFPATAADFVPRRA